MILPVIVCIIFHRLFVTSKPLVVQIRSHFYICKVSVWSQVNNLDSSDLSATLGLGPRFDI